MQLRVQAAPFILTVFSTETPLGADLSVLVQDSATLAPVLHAQVYFESDGKTIPAVLGRSQNKLLYSANVKLPTSGDWPYLLRVDQAAAHVSASGVLQLQSVSEKIASLGYAAIVPAAILLFILRGYLLRRKQLLLAL